jgi:hypothetical protein
MWVFAEPHSSLPSQRPETARSSAGDKRTHCSIVEKPAHGEQNAANAEAISLSLSRRYMTKDDYFDLKSFSYYPRGYSRIEFDADVAASDHAILPFSQTAIRFREPY